jgi:hypothetical protein
MCDVTVFEVYFYFMFSFSEGLDKHFYYLPTSLLAQLRPFNIAENILSGSENFHTLGIN